MEMTVYALTTGFFEYVNSHPNFVKQIPRFSKEQQLKLLHEIDETQLCERAIAYFDSEQIYVKDHILCYENKLRSLIYKIKIDSFCVTIFDYKENPFLPFFKRIYREILLIHDTSNAEAIKEL